jgi:hypothetical protein
MSRIESYKLRSRKLASSVDLLARHDAFRKLILEIGIDGFGKWLQSGDEPGIMVFHDALLQAIATIPIRGREWRLWAN